MAQNRSNSGLTSVLKRMFPVRMLFGSVHLLMFFGMSVTPSFAGDLGISCDLLVARTVMAPHIEEFVGDLYSKAKEAVENVEEITKRSLDYATQVNSNWEKMNAMEASPIGRSIIGRLEKNSDKEFEDILSEEEVDYLKETDFLDQMSDYHKGVKYHAKVEETKDYAAVPGMVKDIVKIQGKELVYMVVDLGGTGLAKAGNEFHDYFNSSTFFRYEPKSQTFKAIQVQGVQETLKCLPKGIYESTIVKLFSPDFKDKVEGSWNTVQFVAPLPKTVAGVTAAAKGLSVAAIRVPLSFRFDALSMSGSAGAMTPELAFVSVPSVTGVGALGKAGGSLLAGETPQLVIALSRSEETNGVPQHQMNSERGSLGGGARLPFKRGDKVFWPGTEAEGYPVIGEVVYVESNGKVLVRRIHNPRTGWRAKPDEAYQATHFDGGEVRRLSPGDYDRYGIERPAVNRSVGENQPIGVPMGRWMSYPDAKKFRNTSSAVRSMEFEQPPLVTSYREVTELDLTKLPPGTRFSVNTSFASGLNVYAGQILEGGRVRLWGPRGPNVSITVDAPFLMAIDVGESTSLARPGFISTKHATYYPYFEAPPKVFDPDNFWGDTAVSIRVTDPR